MFCTFIKQSWPLYKTDVVSIYAFTFFAIDKLTTNLQDAFPDTQQLCWADDDEALADLADAYDWLYDETRPVLATASAAVTIQNTVT